MESNTQTCSDSVCSRVRETTAIIGCGLGFEKLRLQHAARAGAQLPGALKRSHQVQAKYLASGGLEETSTGGIDSVNIQLRSG